ncbi:hypothetical protein G5714_002352 [Onychostoma macrolepis]|uniref:Uncharacterized protein n=1 Tax=Onychostoma macrolepis TaxID=369639 RepID=A0A7J6DEY1_9TELE|nr:hypothetical protein G5714_002352 [Onychostoma macrolepis]
MRARRSLDSAVGQHLKTSSPLAEVRGEACGTEKHGDGLPATKGVSDVSPFIILPCGWLRPSTNTGFSVPVPARCEREDRPERNPCSAHSDRMEPAPDVSVVSSSVSGREGGDLSVQCFYSSGYQNKVKQWCRYKDQSCYTVRRTDTSISQDQ